MTKSTLSRKTRFKAALALASSTQREFAGDNLIHESYLSLLLDGKRNSLHILEMVDAFIAEQEKKAAKRYGAFLRDFRGSAK